MATKNPGDDPTDWVGWVFKDATGEKGKFEEFLVTGVDENSQDLEDKTDCMVEYRSLSKPEQKQVFYTPAKEIKEWFEAGTSSWKKKVSAAELAAKSKPAVKPAKPKPKKKEPPKPLKGPTGDAKNWVGWGFLDVEKDGSTKHFIVTGVGMDGAHKMVDYRVKGGRKVFQTPLGEMKGYFKDGSQKWISSPDQPKDKKRKGAPKAAPAKKKKLGDMPVSVKKAAKADLVQLLAKLYKANEGKTQKVIDAFAKRQ